MTRLAFFFIRMNPFSISFSFSFSFSFTFTFTFTFTFSFSSAPTRLTASREGYSVIDRSAGAFGRNFSYIQSSR